MQRRRQRAFEELQQLAQQLGGHVFDDKGIYTLQLSKQSGNGTIRCINFDAGLFALEYELQPIDDTPIPLCTLGADTIHFMYCFEGGCFYSAGPKDNLVRMNDLQSAIIRTKENCHSQLLVKKGERLRLHAIRIDADIYFKEKEQNPYSVPGKLAAFFICCILALLNELSIVIEKL